MTYYNSWTFKLGPCESHSCAICFGRDSTWFINSRSIDCIFSHNNRLICVHWVQWGGEVDPWAWGCRVRGGEHGRWHSCTVHWLLWWPQYFGALPSQTFTKKVQCCSIDGSTRLIVFVQCKCGAIWEIIILFVMSQEDHMIYSKSLCDEIRWSGAC